MISTYIACENIIPYTINNDLAKPSLSDLEIIAKAPGPGLRANNITDNDNPK